MPLIINISLVILSFGYGFLMSNSKNNKLKKEIRNLEDTVEGKQQIIMLLQSDKNAHERMKSIYDLWDRLQKTGVTFLKSYDVEIKK